MLSRRFSYKEIEDELLTCFHLCIFFLLKLNFMWFTKESSGAQKGLDFSREVHVLCCAHYINVLFFDRILFNEKSEYMYISLLIYI